MNNSVNLTYASLIDNADQHAAVEFRTLEVPELAAISGGDVIVTFN